MANLFSVFEPQSSLFFIPLWSSTVLVLMILPSNFWVLASGATQVFKNILSRLHEEFSRLLGNMQTPGVTHALVTFFVFIFLNNFFGLLPYTFTSSAHLSFSLAMALTGWTGYYVYSVASNPQSALAHLVPLGTPALLTPFMVLIELVSNLIRPITLSVRLAANIVAGHLLLVLMSSPAPSVSWVLWLIIFLFLITLSFLEIAVAVIQSYVFSILSCLYTSEVNTP